MPGMVEPEDAPEPSEVHNFLTLFFQALTTLNHDEMVLAIITFFPLVLALNATMRWMSGNERLPEDDEESAGGHHHKHMSLTAVARQAATAASENSKAALSGVTVKLSTIEKHLQHTQEAHETRFTDLHKDLAGIVWEVTKLRSELAAVQAQQAAFASAAPLSSTGRPVASGESPEAFGARSWRDGRK